MTLIQNSLQYNLVEYIVPRFAQNRIISEGLDKDTLTAYGPEDVSQQGFKKLGILNPVRYNFGNGSYGTFTGAGAPNTLDDLEVTIDAYTTSTEQYILDSASGDNFLKLESDNSITLSIDGVSQSWGAIPEIDGTELTIKFERDGSSVDLKYRDDLGNLVSHPEGVKSFSINAFSIDTVSSTGQGFTGHIFELYLSSFHWTMDEQDQTLVEDGLDSGRNILLQSYSPSDWVVLPNGSTIEHSSNIVGALDTAFVMKDNSTIQSPSLATVFTEQDNSNFAAFGGAFGSVYSYQNAIPVGESLGSTSLNWDRRWDNDIRAYLSLNGTNQNIQASAPLMAITDGLNIIEFELRNYLRANGPIPIFGNTNVGRKDVIGFDANGNMGIVNQGGFAGSGGLIPTDLQDGNWHVRIELNRFANPAASTTVIITDLDGIVPVETYVDQGGIHAGGSLGFNLIGYSPFHSNTFANATISNVKWTQGDGTDGGIGTQTVDLPIDDGTGSVIENLVGADFLANGVDSNSWVYLDPIYAGIFLRTTFVSSTEADLELLSDTGTTTARLSGNLGQFVRIEGYFNPEDDSLRIRVDGVEVPEFVGVDWRYTGAEVQHEPLFQTTCGAPNSTGSEKHVKLTEIGTYTKDSTIRLIEADFIANRIIDLSGYRPITIILTREDDMAAGATVTWQCQSPTTITLKREDNESFVLINITGTPVVVDGSSKGTILCGNVEGVIGHTAYFVSGLDSATINSIP